MFHRILDASSHNPAKPMLCLSFAQKIPSAYALSRVTRDVNWKELAKGVHYAVILYVLRENNFLLSSPEALFASVLSTLRVLGYRPKAPCEPARLAKGEPEDHTNLCVTLETAVFERALTVEKLVDDLKRLPRSFYVLREHPGDIDDAIKLWLNKAHCVPEVADLENVEQDVRTFTHFAAALSRAFPSRIRRGEIKKGKNMSAAEIEVNRKNVFEILDEVGAFMPAAFPVESALFRAAIADLYYLMRPNMQKFVKVVAPAPVVGVRPMSAKLPSIDRKTKNGVKPKKVVMPVSPRRSLKKMVMPVSPRRKSEAEELLEIYGFMCKGERKDKFVEVEDPKPLIDAIVEMMDLDEREQTFANLDARLSNLKQAALHMQNGSAFLLAISGNNNEFQASRNAVFFARRMIKTQVATRPASTKAARRARPQQARVCSSRKLASIATQTATMTQTVSAVRDAVLVPAKEVDSSIETNSASTQTEKMIAYIIQKHYETTKDRVATRPMTASPFCTISFPYGADASAFAPKRAPVKREPLSARRRKVL